MKRDLVYLPEVSRDFAQAYNYYRMFSLRVGQRFERAFNQAEQEVEDGLITHRLVCDFYHRVSLKRFPYILYYRLEGTKAIIVGLLYSRLNPQQIEAALKSRNP